MLVYTSYTPLFPASQALLLTTSPHKLLKCLVFQAHFSEARGCTFQRNQRQFPGLRQKIINTGCMDKQEVVGLIEADRKSTRLNSSHVRISYAVFCLKKKRRWFVCRE